MINPQQNSNIFPLIIVRNHHQLPLVPVHPIKISKAFQVFVDIITIRHHELPYYIVAFHILWMAHPPGISEIPKKPAAEHRRRRRLCTVHGTEVAWLWLNKKYWGCSGDNHQFMNIYSILLSPEYDGSIPHNIIFWRTFTVYYLRIPEGFKRWSIKCGSHGSSQ